MKAYPQALYYPLRTYVLDCKCNTPPPPFWTPDPPPEEPVLAKQLSAAGAPPSVGVAAAATPAGASGAGDPAALTRCDSQTVVIPLLTPQFSTDVVGVEAAGAIASACLSTAASSKLESTGKKQDDDDLVLHKTVEKNLEIDDQVAEEEAAAATGGPAACVLAALHKELPQLTAQMVLVADLLTANLLPSPTEILLASVCDLLFLCLSLPAGVSDQPPAEVEVALRTIETAMTFASATVTDVANEASNSSCMVRRLSFAVPPNHAIRLFPIRTYHPYHPHTATL